MEYNFITNIESCYVEIPHLLYYSHIPTAIIVLLFGLFLLFKNSGNRLLSIILFLISFIFSIWTIFDIVLWQTYSSVMMMSLWSLFGLMYILIYISSLYFVYVFVDQRDISRSKKWFLSLLLLPILIATPTIYNLSGFDIENCQPIENLFFNLYQYSLGIFIIIWILHLIYTRYMNQVSRRRPILLVGSGILLFLLAFSWSEIVGSFSENFEITQYGLFGAPIFIGFLVYSIVKFHTFNIKLIATQALVWVLAILIGAQFFFIKNPVNYILNGFTFVASIIFGYFLIKSVKREIEQKEKLEKLNIDLKTLIKQRESLVHLVTHKIKGSFTRSKYIFAGILDGTFGEVNTEVKKRATQGLESDNIGINTVDLILNVANMQSGTVKYDMKTLDFKEIILKTFTDKKVQAEAKGLLMESEIHDDKNDVYKILGDAFWLREAVNNLIDNAIKYTKTGKITIGLSDGNGKVKFSIKDTGIGITDEDKKLLFTEGGRGKDSVRTNVDSTGYGLYSVKLIIDEHKGRVWAESELGKGSTFYIELDATV